MILILLMTIVELGSALTNATFYENRLHIEETAEMPSLYIIHYDEEFWIDYDSYWQAPMIQASINITQNTGVSNDNF